MLNIRAHLTRYIFIGLFAGVVSGLLLGPYGVVFKPIGTIYTDLMVVIVFPYIICSLIYALGKMSPQISKIFFIKGLLVFVLLMVLVYSVLLILSQSLPNAVSLLYNPNELATAKTVKLLDVFVPSNIFRDISDNHVPAIIIFCVIFGVMLQKVEGKQSFLTILEVISKVCLKFWDIIVLFTPLAVFSYMSELFGTIGMHQLYDIGFFLLLYIMASLLICFWLLPIILCALLGLSYHRIIYDLRDAFFVATVTFTVAALPLLEKILMQFLKEKGVQEDNQKALVDASLTIAYSFTQVGNYILYLFILFAAAFYGKTISTADSLLLPVMTLTSFIGTYNSTINAYEFLMQYLGYPKESMVLFMQVITMTRYIQPLTAVMGFYFFSAMTLALCYKLIKLNKRRLFLNLGIFLIFLILIPIAIRSQLFLTYCFLLLFYFFILCLWWLTKKIKLSNKKTIVMMLILVGVLTVFMLFIPSGNLALLKNVTHKRLTIATQLQKSVDFSVEKDLDPLNISDTNIDTLQVLSRYKQLKFGIHAADVPISYFNQQGQLVGFATEFGFKMAAQLNVSLQLVLVPPGEMLSYLDKGWIDIAMTADFLDPKDYDKVSYSQPLRYSRMVFLTQQKHKRNFENIDDIGRYHNKTIGVTVYGRWIDPLRHYLPQANFVSVKGLAGGLSDLRDGDVSALILPFYYAMTVVYEDPDLVVVVPSGAKLIMPFSFVMRKNSPNFLAWVDHWIGVLKEEGFYESSYSKWILGHQPPEKVQRWSIIDWLVPSN